MTASIPGGGLLQQLSDEMAGAVERAGTATVRVSARRRLPATGIAWTTQNGGTIVVTANHVVERDEDISITTSDGSEHAATLVGRDPGSDLAALKVDGVHLTTAQRNGGARVGSIVLALGRAGELSATTGVVSAAGGPWRMGRGRRFDSLIATDAPMFPGFSGGPLVDVAGNVLGLLSSHLGRGQTLAIPAEEIDRIAASLGQHGRMRRGYLGVAAQPVALPANLRQNQSLEQERALLLIGVEEGGPAAAAGLTIGDIVVAVAGNPVEGLDDLRTALDSGEMGSAVNVSILRGGEPREITVTLGERPEQG